MTSIVQQHIDIKEELKSIITKVLSYTPVKDKIDIHNTYLTIGEEVNYQDPISKLNYNIQIGDDCAAIPQSNGETLLFAAEGIIPPFVESYPWFAGYSSVMVNISDVCAMGGLPMAVTDVLWAQDAHDAAEIWKGINDAAEAYGVPVVGGHTCYRSSPKHLAVSILGKAHALISSYAASAGDALFMVVDLEGKYFADYPFWNASTTSSTDKLRKNSKLLYEVANKNWAHAGKDISMGGIIGTLAMLLHTSKVGAVINLDQIPKPIDVEWDKWLISFPSFGYLLACKDEHVEDLNAFFAMHNLASAKVGCFTENKGLGVELGGCIEKIF